MNSNAMKIRSMADSAVQKGNVVDITNLRPDGTGAVIVPSNDSRFNNGNYINIGHRGIVGLKNSSGVSNYRKSISFPYDEMSQAIKDNNFALVKQIYDSNKNSLGSMGMTLIMSRAVENSSKEMVQYLVNLGFPMSFSAKFKYMLIHSNPAEIKQYILNNNLSQDQLNRALRLAVKHNNAEMTKFILIRGVDFDDVASAIKHMINNNETNFIGLFIDNGLVLDNANFKSIILMAIRRNRPDIIKALINSNKYDDEQLKYVMRLAVDKDNMDLVVFLTNKGAMIDHSILKNARLQHPEIYNYLRENYEQ